MDIRKHTSFFHDGGIIDIQSKANNIEIWMESSELLPEWNEDNISLSNEQTIRGKLKLFDVIQISINGELVNQIEKKYDDGEILKFRINGDCVILLLMWSNFPPKNKIDVCESIEIQAKEIYWENIPDLRYD